MQAASRCVHDHVTHNWIACAPCLILSCDHGRAGCTIRQSDAASCSSCIADSRLDGQGADCYLICHYCIFIARDYRWRMSLWDFLQCDNLLDVFSRTWESVEHHFLSCLGQQNVLGWLWSMCEPLWGVWSFRTCEHSEPTCYVEVYTIFKKEKALNRQCPFPILLIEVSNVFLLNYRISWREDNSSYR